MLDVRLARIVGRGGRGSAGGAQKRRRFGRIALVSLGERAFSSPRERTLTGAGGEVGYLGMMAIEMGPLVGRFGVHAVAHGGGGTGRSTDCADFTDYGRDGATDRQSNHWNPEHKRAGKSRGLQLGMDA